MSAESTYKIHAGPPLLSQVCLLCGAEVGSRAIHDAWHALTGGSTETADKQPADPAHTDGCVMTSPPSQPTQETP